MSCPTCTGPVGMVCQACGTDYGSIPARVVGVDPGVDPAVSVATVYEGVSLLRRVWSVVVAERAILDATEKIARRSLYPKRDDTWMWKELARLARKQGRPTRDGLRTRSPMHNPEPYRAKTGRGGRRKRMRRKIGAVL